MNLANLMLLSGLVSFLCSACLTHWVRRYALSKSILDIPNERSSHSIPTPRGGGIAIVTTFLLGVSYAYWQGHVEATLFAALLGGGLAIAALGYCDDVYSVKTRTRIALHFLIAAWALFCLGGYTTTHFWIGTFLAYIGVVWCINFYNFMDGIDGLASSEGIFVSLGSAIALACVGAHSVALLFSLLATAIAGFAIWNWPPAKIFLGDVGSGFLGYVFAVLGLYTVNHNLLPLAFWWLILAIFIWDATFTVVYRGFQGKRWYLAHREHAYQRLVEFGANHKQVTLAIVVINVLILFPGALLTLYHPDQSLWLIGASAFALWLTWYRIKSM